MLESACKQDWHEGEAVFPMLWSLSLVTMRLLLRRKRSDFCSGLKPRCRNRKKETDWNLARKDGWKRYEALTKANSDKIK